MTDEVHAVGVDVATALSAQEVDPQEESLEHIPEDGTEVDIAGFRQDDVAAEPSLSVQKVNPQEENMEHIPDDCTDVAVQNGFAQVGIGAEPVQKVDPQEKNENLEHIPNDGTDIAGFAVGAEPALSVEKVDPQKENMEHVRDDGTEVDLHVAVQNGFGQVVAAEPTLSIHEGDSQEENMEHIPDDGSKFVQERTVSAGLYLIGQIESSDSTSSDSDSSSLEMTVDTVDTQKTETESVCVDEVSESNRTCVPAAREIEDNDDSIETECCIPFPENGRLLSIGKVFTHFDKIVVIHSWPGTPPVDAGTVLWNSDKESLAPIFETFGPVKSPYYSVKINALKDIDRFGLSVGALVYVVPGNLDLTKYVFTNQLMKLKGSDASWKDDTEIPHQLLEFSDDEVEHESRKPTKTMQRKQQRCHTNYRSVPTHNQSFSAQHFQHPQFHSSECSVTSPVMCNYQYPYPYPIPYNMSLPNFHGLGNDIEQYFNS